MRSRRSVVKNAWNAMWRRAFWICTNTHRGSVTWYSRERNNVGSRHRCSAVYMVSNSAARVSLTLYTCTCSNAHDRSMDADVANCACTGTSWSPLMIHCIILGETTMFILTLFVSWMLNCAFKILRKMYIITKRSLSQHHDPWPWGFQSDT